ncbi:RNA polymerase II C-terminal domain phosphatase-like 4 [Rosa rugosa]|uniref:RNA polymerase II C-terminal domain phosphatase-like 4 n=1 Tax=Rosa rugosa TaxID=74645 RepID=UPI002B4168FC|nr:RNA polymerase II C-terminal domain phosphatase-like 4 [Rosa rugosa]
MLHHRKLHLVLNLDRTLLDHAQLSDLTPEEEEYVKTLTMDHPLPLQDVLKVQDCPKMKPIIFKLRPFARAFLKEASDMFEIYAYSNASRYLVWKMVELLDPTNEYFGHRVISREDFISTFAGKKCLDLVLAQESTVLILDHKKETWTEQNQNNIVLTQKYQFFKGRSEQNSEFKSHCELKTDEGAYLAVILQHLKLIHSSFFDDQVMCDNLIERDVRKVLKNLRQQKLAEQLGTTCDEQMDLSTTQVAGAHVGLPARSLQMDFPARSQEVASNYEMAKRRNLTIDHGGTTSSTDHQEIGVVSASSLCDYCANFADRYGFLHEGLLTTLSAEHIYRLHKHNTQKMLVHKKLHLVINLDHTFLSHTRLSDLTPEEAEYLKVQEDSQDIFTVRVPPKMKPIIIKFRPFLRTFLKEASDFFEIYAYANAPRSLVWKIVELLDPRNEYFGRRVISRENFCSTHRGKKSLDLVLGQKSAVLVVDDEEDGWQEKNRNNVMLLGQYCFFKKTSGKKRKRKSLCELKSDERAASLASLLKQLKRIHNRFFNDEIMCDNLFDRDVRVLLKVEWDSNIDDSLQFWRKAVSNCMRKKIVASFNYQPKNLAEQSSRATCVEEQVDDPSSLEVAEAAHVGKSPARSFHLSWIDISIRLWQKSNVEKNPVMIEDSEFTCSSCGCSSYVNTPESLCRSLYSRDE